MNPDPDTLPLASEEFALLYSIYIKIKTAPPVTSSGCLIK